MNRKIAVVVGVAVAVVVIGFVALRGGGGGPGGPSTPTATPVAGTSQTPVVSATPGGPMGALTATVTFTGAAPAPRKIRKTPECGSDPLLDEEVKVKDGKLANVMVRVVDGAPAQPGSGQGIEIVQEKCVYLPRVGGIVAGQSVAVTSKDAFLHNVHTFSGDVSIFNKGQPAPSTFVKEAADFSANGKPITNGPITFKCDVHPWMVSHVVVNPNPYFAVSGDDGIAKIALPPGKYKVEAWHEKLGVKTTDVEVAADAPAEIAIAFP